MKNSSKPCIHIVMQIFNRDKLQTRLNLEGLKFQYLAYLFNIEKNFEIYYLSITHLTWFSSLFILTKSCLACSSFELASHFSLVSYLFLFSFCISPKGDIQGKKTKNKKKGNSLIKIIFSYSSNKQIRITSYLLIVGTRYSVVPHYLKCSKI